MMQSRRQSVYRQSMVPAGAHTTTAPRIKSKVPLYEYDTIITQFEVVGIPLTQEGLNKPTPELMNRIVEGIATKLLNVQTENTKANSLQVSETASNDLQVQNENIPTGFINVEPLRLANSAFKIAHLKTMYTFFHDVGITDFSIRDILKPEQVRLRLILSAVLNFIYYREECGKKMEFSNQNIDTLINKYGNIIRDSYQLLKQIKQIEHQIENRSIDLEELKSKTDEAGRDLKRLKIDQESLYLGHQKYKSEKYALYKIVEDQNYLIQENEKAVNTIKSYLKESPLTIANIVERLEKDLEAQNIKCSNLEASNREHSLIIDQLKGPIEKTTELLNIMESIQEQVAKYDNLESLTQQQQKTKEDYTKYISELNANMNNIITQIQKGEEKLRKTKESDRAKLESRRAKLKESEQKLAISKEEKFQGENEIKNLGLQIRNLNQQIAGLQKEYDVDLKELDLSMKQLNFSIGEYITKMNTKMGLPL